MNNKRNWIILAVILLLLIGLGAYVFAGSDEELLPSTGNNSSETDNSANTTNTENTLEEEEEEESNTNTQTNTNTGGTTNTGTTNNTVTVASVDTSYDDAEEAVIKAESTLTQTDVDSAAALIEAVTTGTDTTSLTERLEAVQSLIDLTSLVNTLKSYVDDATSLSDITDARTYESANTIISSVESLDASDTKTSLTDIIDSISSILEDETSPVISVSTLNSEGYASSAITVTVTEDNNYTIYLDGVETTLNALSSLTDGTYTIKVVDASYNEQSVTFTIDTTSPTATIVADNTVTNGKINFTVTVDEENVDTVEYAFSGYTTLENLATLSADRWVSVTLDENNEFTITRTSIDAYLWVRITDKAGNVSYIKSDDKYMIDKEAPTITVSEYTGNATENSYSEIKLTIKDNYNLASISINENITNISGTEYELTIDNTYDDGEYEIVVTDEAGNSETYAFVLDTTAPEATVSFGVVGKTTRYATVDDLVRVTLTFDEELATLPTVVLNGTTYTAKLASSSNGTYTYQAQTKISESTTNGKVTFTASGYADATGNVGTTYTEADFEEIIIDTVAPVINNLTHGRWYDSAVTISIDEENIDTIKLETIQVENGVEISLETTEIENGTVLTDEYKYILTVTDKVGYTATVAFGIDATNPTITLNNTEYSETKSEVIYFNEDVTVNITDNTLYSYSVTKDGTDLNWEEETTYEEEGTYVVTAKDKHGSKVTVTFVIDKTRPTLNYGNGSIVESASIVVTDDNFDYMTITNRRTGETVTITDTTYTIEEDADNVRYTIKAYDKAGNLAGTSTYEQIDIYIDNQDPTISATGVNSKGTVTVEDNGIYQSVDLTVTDGSLTSIVVTKSGNDYIKKTFDANYTSNDVTYNYSFTEEGTYVVTATDRFGHASTITFVIDTTPAARVFSTLDFDGTGKSYEEVSGNKYYYVTNGDSFVFRMKFSEELAEVPTVTIGGQEIEMVLLENLVTKNGEYVYQGTFTIDENETTMSEGELEIVVSNIVDLAGNVTSDLVQTPTSNGRIAVYDRTEATATFSPVAGYYNKYTTITVSIDDDNIAEAYYLWHKSGTLIDNIVNGEWRSLTITNNTTSMAFAADGFSFYLWVKLVDKAGNVSYIGSDGLYVIDTEAPTIAGVEEGKIYTSAITPSITDNYELESVKLYIDGVEQTYQVGDTIQTGSGKYQLVATDKAGNETIVNFRMSKISTTITLTAPNSLVYDGTAKKYTAVVTDEDGNILNNVTVQYNYSDGTNSKIDAINAGDYSVAVYYAGDDTYKAAYVYQKFTIEKATVYVEFGTGNLTYTGSGLEYGYTIYRGDTDITNSGEISYVVTYKSTDGGTTGNCTIDNGTQKSGCVLPTDIGSYTISITVRENDNYNYSSGIYTGFKIVGSTSINGVSYKTVAAAISAANQSATPVTITLNDNATLETAMGIANDVTIDLNGHDLTLDYFVRPLEGSTLTIDGEGTLISNYAGYSAIDIIGSSDPSAEMITLNIGKDVTIEADNGIFIFQTSGTNNAYNVTVNIAGTINAKEYYGIYINGTAKNTNGYPIITLTETASINSSAIGIYAAGYAEWNIQGASITGVDSAIAIKSGILNIEEGSALTATGVDSTPTQGYGNGVYASGTALQIESNSGYAGNMVINISGGTLKSTNSYALYEYIGSGSATTVSKINVYGGTFVADAKDSAILVSDEFKTTFSEGFISGGTYSSDVTDYLISGYKVQENDDNTYTVVEES